MREISQVLRSSWLQVWVLSHTRKVKPTPDRGAQPERPRISSSPHGPPQPSPTRRDGLELEVMKLRDARQTLSEEAYFSRLESLLVEMARIYGQ